MGEKLTPEEYEAAISKIGGDSMELISEFETDTVPGPSLHDLYMLSYVQGQRIYDLLALLLVQMGHVQAVEEMMNIHAAGKFKAPPPEIDNTGV